MGKIVGDVLVMGAPTANADWPRIHSSIYRQVNRATPWVSATAIANDAFRFRCPATGSFVLLTDEATLAKLKKRVARLRCNACGELHLLRIGTAMPKVRRHKPPAAT